MATSTGKTLLVVEDDIITREGLAVVLREAGYTVAVAANGTDAIDHLLANPTSLVLLDMMMPACDGWSVLHRHLKDLALTAIPVVIMTALGVASLEWAIGLGAAGYLRKPFDVPALLQEVQRCLETPRG
jgi:CheY-like chemotaxis protein